MNEVGVHQKSDSFFIAAVLTIIGGYLDAYTYTLRDGVLANAQTGNMVFMVVNLMKGNMVKAFTYFIPIFFFVIGVFIVEKLRFSQRFPSILHWQQIILMIELIILLIVSFIPSGVLNTPVNISIALICSMQVQSFKKVQGNPFASTMCTGNLRSGSECFFIFLRTGESSYLKSAQYYFAIIGYFFIGVAMGTFLSKYFIHKSALFCCFLLFICLFKLKRAELTTILK